MSTFHTHSDYSTRDGISKVRQIAEFNKNNGKNYFVITDHGNCNCYAEAFAVAKEMGMSFVPGCELYIQPPEEHDARINNEKVKNINKEMTNLKNNPEELEKKKKELEEIMIPGYAERNFHLTVLAYNRTGMSNLFKIMRESHMYFKIRSPLEVVKKYNEGLIVLTGCPAGQFFKLVHLGLRHSREDYFQKAEEYLKDMKSVFGDRLYFELMYHQIQIDSEDNTQGEFEKEINIKCLEIAKRNGIKAVGTNDSHYTTPDMRRYWEITRRAFLGNSSYGLDGDYHMEASNDRLTSVFEGYLYLNELNNSEKEIEDRFENIDGLTMSQYQSTKEHQETLERLVWTGYNEKRIKPYLKALENNEPEETISNLKKWMDEDLLQIPYELSVIQTKGFDNYFLKTLDLVKTAHEKGVMTGPARGSGAGSSCVYMIGITDVDPMKFELMFERFLNPLRNSMPDVDIDFLAEGCSNFDPDDEYKEFIANRSSLISDDKIRDFWEKYKKLKEEKGDKRRESVFDNTPGWKTYFDAPIFDVPEDYMTNQYQ